VLSKRSGYGLTKKSQLFLSGLKTDFWEQGKVRNKHGL
jgi:hypothetical protein